MTSRDSSRVAMTDVSPSSRPSLLPAPRTPLIGREQDMAVVPEGAHEVVFTYDPTSFRLGLGIAGGGMLALLALVVGLTPLHSVLYAVGS